MELIENDKIKSPKFPTETNESNNTERNPMSNFKSLQFA